MDNIKIIIYAVAVLGALGAIFGLVLAFAAKKFAVATDPRYDAILEALPGANCGGCGYPGCGGYAEAIMHGEPTNLCLPGGDSTAAEIASILGIEAEDVKELVALVHCNGGNHAANKYEYTGIRDCRTAANSAGGGPTVCDNACLGLGSCVDVCDYGAMAIVDGVAKVNRRLCSGCMKCVSACPKNIIKMVPLTADVKALCSNKDRGANVRKYCQVGCIACKLCEKNCPEDAIHVVDNLAVIDYDKCTGCGVCVTKCPQKTIINEANIVSTDN